jgi:hypothetical protein
LKRFIFRNKSWSANSQRLLGYLLERQYRGAFYWKHSIGAKFAGGSRVPRVEPAEMSKPSRGILPVWIFLMFPGRGSRRRLARGFGELGVAIASKVLCLSRAVSKILRN